MCIPCTLISARFNDSGFKGICGLMDEFVKINNRFNYDYLIKIDADCVLNSFDNITAIETRLIKQTSTRSLAHIGTYSNGVCFDRAYQVLTKVGIGAITNICSSILKQPNKETEVMKKRIDLGKDINTIISVLLDMSPVYRCNTEFIEGIKGHINASEFPTENYWRWTSVAFKPTNNQWSKEESLRRMKDFVNSNHDPCLPFKKYIKGKTVALVGNATPTNDYSEEIDKADIVIRLNNFYNYNSGKVGKKTDCLVLNGIAALCDDPNNGTEFNDDVIQKYKPNIFLVSETFNQEITRLHKRYKGCSYTMLGNRAIDIRYTTGTFLLKMLADMDDVQCNFYAFDSDDKWKKYVETNSVKVLNCGVTDEEKIRYEAMSKILNNKRGVQ